MKDFDFSKFGYRFKWLLMNCVYQGVAEQKIWADILGLDPSVLSRLFKYEDYGMQVPQLLKALKNLDDVMTPELMYWLFYGKGLDPLKLPLSTSGGKGGETTRVLKRRERG